MAVMAVKTCKHMQNRWGFAYLKEALGFTPEQEASGTPPV